MSQVISLPRQRRHLPSVRMVLVSSLLSATLTVVGLSLASDHIVELANAAPWSASVHPAPENTYEVRPGDTLSLIAARELGDRERWPELYRANRDRLHAPSELEVGTNLRLPGTSP